MPTDQLLIAPPDKPALAWYQGLSRHQWFVLLVCSLAWLFDTMDMQLFVLSRNPAMTELLGSWAANNGINKFGGIATSFFMVGAATGGIFFGVLGDRWGRAKTMFAAIFTYSIFTGLSGFSTNWFDFSIYRLLAGIGIGGTFGAAVSLIAETMPARSRSYALGFMQALAAIGNMVAAGVSFLIPPSLIQHGISGWRMIFFVGVVPAFLGAMVMRKLKEPAAWIKAKEDRLAGTSDNTQRLGSLRELFSDRQLRRNTLVGIALGLAGVTGLWGVGFYLPELIHTVVPKTTDNWKATADWYASMGMLLFNAAAVLGTFALSYIMNRLGRRAGFAIIFLIAILTITGVFGFMTKPAQVWWMAPLLGIGTLSVFGGFSIYFPELFPVRLRATGTGVCYNTARYVSASAPLTFGMLTVWLSADAGTPRSANGLASLTILSSLGSIDNPIRYAAIILASAFIIGLAALPFAPETKGKPLPL